MQPCDTVVKQPLTSAPLMLSYYTKRRLSHNLIYTMDYTFSYCLQEICLWMLVLNAHGSKIRGRNFKHFKTSVECAK